MNIKRFWKMALALALTLALLTGCGKSVYSGQAVSAVNKAQTIVSFTTSTELDRALQAALEDYIQINDVRDAMIADENLQELLTSGYQLNVFAVSADGAESAAKAIAQQVAGIVAGKQAEGKIALVLADNGYYYAAVLTYRASGSSGSDGDDKPVTSQSIEVTANPTKTEYAAGETFDPSGMEIVVTYSDGSSEVISSGGFSYTPDGPLTEGTNQITITYNGVHTTVSITVGPAKVVSIAVTTQPTKTEYYEGDSLNTSGMVVTATMSDGSEQAITNYTCSPDPVTGTGQQTITVSYNDDPTITTTFTVNVKEVVLESIAVSGSCKTTYTVGDSFDPSGLTVTAHYNNGKKETVTDYNCSYGVLNSVNIKEVEISYGGKTATVPITVNPRLTVDMSGAKKTEFTVGEKFSTITGSIGVYLEETLGNKQKITYPAYYTITPETFTTAGDNIPVTLTYYNNTNVSATVYVKVVEPPPISLTTNATLKGQLTEIYNLFKTEAAKYSSYTIGSYDTQMQETLNKLLDQNAGDIFDLQTALEGVLKAPVAYNVAESQNETEHSFVKTEEFEEGVTEEKYYLLVGVSTTADRIGTAKSWIKGTGSGYGELAEKIKYIDDAISDIKAADQYGNNTFTIYFSITDVNDKGVDYRILVERVRTPQN